MSAEPFFKTLVAWASSEEIALAAGLCGSYARGEQRPGSDVDVILVCGESGELLTNTSWTSQFGAVLRSEREDYGLVTSIRVFYETNLEVEFGITSRRWCFAPMDSGTAGVINAGFKALYDPESLLAEAQALAAQQSI